MQKLLIAGLSSAVGLLSFVVGFQVHFPGEAVVERSRWQLQDATGGQWALEALDASWWMPAGVTFEDAVLYQVDAPKRRKRRKKRNTDAEDGAEVDDTPLKAVPFLRADKASVRLALLPLLTGSRTVDFGLEVYGGAVDGSFTDEAEFSAVQASAADLDLSRMPMSGEDWSMDATGVLTSTVDLRMAKDTTRDGPGHDGTVRMEIENFAIQSASVMGIDLMPAVFSQAVLELEMDGTKAEVREGRFEADILDLKVDGHVNMNSDSPDRWRLRLELQLELGDQLDTMAGMLPMLKRSKDDEGVYHLLCSGTVGRPTCREDRSKVRGGPTSTARPPAPGRIGNKPPLGMPTGGRDKDEDAEDRRRKRRERIKERRDKLRREREERAQDRDSIDEEIIDEPEFEDMREPMRPFPGEPGMRPEFPEDDFDNNPDIEPPPNDMDIGEPLEDVGYLE